MIAQLSRKYPVLFLLVVSLVLFAAGVAAVRVGFPARVTVTWETASEVDTAGFIIYRSRSREGPLSAITESPVPAQGDPLAGASYRFEDEDVVWGERYFYQLEEVERDGTRSRHPEVVEGRAGVGWAWAIAAGAVLGILGTLSTTLLIGVEPRPSDRVGAAGGPGPDVGGPE